jgi:lipopolysaccharide/colanic/teichoic acid biosynthesis glycosyltransferase
MNSISEQTPATVSGEVSILQGKLDEDWSTPYYLFRRTASIAFSLGALAAFLPPVVLLGLLTKLESPGPIFYKGRRVGKDGKIFMMYKLRTLKNNVESQIGVHLLQEDSQHFTRIGRFVRRTKLDEIPQFYNVLCGHMSIVGPRPVRPIRARLFLKTIPGFRHILQVKPGITGLSQVMADYYDPADKKFQYDVQYIANRCLWLDLKVAAATVLRVPMAMLRQSWGNLRNGTGPAGAQNKG